VKVATAEKKSKKSVKEPEAVKDGKKPESKGEKNVEKDAAKKDEAKAESKKATVEPENEACKSCGLKHCGGAADAKTKEKADCKEKDDAKGEVSKKNEVKANEGKKVASGNKEWTEAQDAKIKEMKAANKPWAEICAEVHASKKDIQLRFKELSNKEATQEAAKIAEVSAGAGENNDNTWGDANNDSTWGDASKDTTWGETNKETTWGDSNKDTSWGVAVDLEVDENNNNTSFGFGDAFNSTENKAPSFGFGDAFNSAVGDDKVCNSYYMKLAYIYIYNQKVISARIILT